MKRVILTFVFIFIVATFTIIVSAQDDTAECDYTDAFAEIVELANGDPTLETLDMIDALISQARIDCNGFSWSSDIEGMSPVIGPFIVPQGVYIATLTTDGFLIADPTILDGDCGRDVGRSWFSTFEGDAVDGESVILEFEEDCEVLLEIGNTTESWTIVFELIR